MSKERDSHQAQSRRSGWRVALRMARRDVARAKRRNVLIVLMIGLPVLLSAGLSLVLHTANTDAGSTALRMMGPTDALVNVQGLRIKQDFVGESMMGSGSVADPADRTMTVQRINQLTGGKALAFRVGSALVKTRAGLVGAHAKEFDLRDNRTSGLGTIVDGRAPRTSGEVAVSPRLVHDGVGPGQVINLGVDGRKDLAVVGVVRNPGDLNSRQLVGLPGSVLTAGAAAVSTEYLLDTGGKPITWADVRKLNTHGLAVRSRAVIEKPPPADQLPSEFADMEPGIDVSMVSFTAIVTACVLLEVVLLAGPAFAVGARRQRRQLAQLVATGGTPKDVRRVVLAQAGLLGLGSSLAGVVVAIIIVGLTLPLASGLIGSDIAPLRVAPLDLLALVVVGTIAGLAAAYLPARQAARQDTVRTLTGRRGEARPRRGWPVAGLVLIASGAAAVFAFGRSGSNGVGFTVLGTFALVAGAIMLIPSVVGQIGRIGGGFPLALRLAARDSARNRSRTTSAVAAVMGVVTGVTALAVASASDFEGERRDYVPQAAAGTMTVSLNSERSQTAVASIADQVRAIVPGHTPLLLQAVPDTSTGTDSRHVVAVMPGCQKSDVRQCQPVPGDNTVQSLSPMPGGMAVGDARTIAALVGHPLTADQRRVLAAGGVLLPSKVAVGPDGTAAVATYVENDTSDKPVDVRMRRLPAAPLSGTVSHGTYVYLGDLVATPQTAERLGLELVASALVVLPGQPAITKEQQAKVEELSKGLGYAAGVYVERGFDKTYTLQFLALALLAGLLVLVGTVTATALALDDAGPDFATLAAVGAAPRTRRQAAMAQAAVIAVTGALFGVVLGTVPGIAMTWPLTVIRERTVPVIDIPWGLLGLVVLVVPLLSILGTGVFTRSRQPIVRRAG